MNAIMTDPVLFVLCMALAIWCAVGLGALAGHIDNVRSYRANQLRLDAKYDEFVAMGKDMDKLTPAEQRMLICPYRRVRTTQYAKQLKRTEP